MWEEQSLPPMPTALLLLLVLAAPKPPAITVCVGGAQGDWAITTVPCPCSAVSATVGKRVYREHRDLKIRGPADHRGGTTFPVRAPLPQP